MRTFILTLLCCFSISAFPAYKGTVYFIESNNPQHVQKPLEGVAVTDGLNVVKTDKNGRFTLPGYDKTRFISVTTPAGYITENYYIRVDESKDKYDFILIEDSRTKDPEHSFIQITDTEIHGNGIGIWATHLKNYIESEQPAFLMHTGDICYENGLRSHIKSVNSQSMGIPVYYGIGNHDLVKGNYGEELFESIYGPTWYSFDVGNTHYVMTPMLHGDHTPSYTKEDVYRWLVNDLKMMKKGQNLIVFNHDILTASDDFSFGINEQESVNLREYNLKAWIYGHWHYNYVRNQNGVYTICTSTVDKGGIDHSTSAFRVIDVSGNGEVSSQLRYAFNPAHVAIVSPMNGQNSPILVNGKLPVSANIYNSNAEVKNIEYKISDSLNNNVISSGSITDRRSDWNWYTSVEIPSGYLNKSLDIQITSTFNNGEKAYASNTFLYTNISSPIVEGNAWNTLLSNAQHTGQNTVTTGSDLNLVWTNNMRANIFMTSPVIAESKVFIASTDDNINPKSAIAAFDRKTGKELWKYPTRNSVKNTIAYSEGIVAAQDAESNLYIIDANTGKLKWEKKLDNSSYPYSSEGLTIENNILYAGTGLSLTAFDLNSGKSLWQNTGWKKNEAATTTLTIGGDVLINGSQWGALYANNKNTGEFLWKISEDGMSDRGSSPTYHEGKLYVISRKSLFIIDPSNGNILEKKDFSFNLDVTSTPYIGKHEIIFGTANKGLVALDKENLTVKWNIQTNPSLVFSAPYTTFPDASIETSIVVAGNNAYFGASDGYLYIVNIPTGLINQKINLGAPVFSSFALSGNTLIAADYGGNIYAFTSK